MPLFTLLWIITWALGSYIYLAGVCEAGAFDTESTASFFSYAFNSSSSTFFSLIIYLVLAIPVCGICFWKLQRHKLLLDQMANFSLQNAKCALETDRLVISEQVLSLFDEALQPPLSVAFGAEADEGSESLLSPRTLRDIRPVTSYPTNDQIIDQFNAYVRGPVRDSVLQSIGQESNISFKLCVFTLWPWLCFSLVRDLGCYGARGADCEKAALQAGFHSVWQYTMINIFCEVCLTLSGALIAIPLVLQACDWIGQLELVPAVRWCLGSCLAACIMFLSDAHAYLEHWMLMVAKLKNPLIGLTGLICSVTLDLWALWFLFFRKGHQNHPRMMARG